MSDDENLPPDDDSHGSHRGNTPDADADLALVAEKVAEKWAASPNITLEWITSDEFGSQTSIFTTKFNAKASAKGGRKVTTKEFRLLDNKIDSNLFRIKDGLKEKYGPDLFESHYGQFGIVKVGHNYILPRDRASRYNSLKLILEGLESNGLSNMEYGLHFWQTIYTQYGQYLNSTIATDGNVSSYVKDKNQAKKIVKKTLNCLIKVIKGKYPDTWKHVLREWGFQKEKY